MDESFNAAFPLRVLRVFPLRPLRLKSRGTPLDYLPTTLCARNIMINELDANEKDC